MKKTTATCTWVLAILIAAGTLLATTQTSYADRDRDGGRDRQDQRSWNDRDRDRQDQQSWNGRDRDQRGDRDIDRGRDRPWGRYDNYRSFRRPPIAAMQGFGGTRVLIIRGPVVIMTWGGSPYSYGGWR